MSNFGVSDKKGCLNGFFGVVRTYGKSPCFSASSFLMVPRVDWQTPILMDVDGVEFLD